MRHILIVVILLIAGFARADSNPYKGKAQQIPGKVEAEHYDEGKPGEAYLDIDKPNQGADYRGPTQVDIEKRPDASNGHGIGWTRKGEWLNYTVEVKEPGTYTIEMPVASKKMGGLFVLEIKGKSLCKPIRIPDTGGWDKLKLIKCADVKLDRGRHIIRVVMLDQGPSGSIGDIDYFKFAKKSSSSEASSANTEARRVKNCSESGGAARK